MGEFAAQRRSGNGLRLPAAKRNQGPDRLDDAERPGSAQEAVERGKQAGAGEGKDEPVTLMLESVEAEHRGDGEKPEQRQRVQGYASSRRCLARTQRCVPVSDRVTIE